MWLIACGGGGAGAVWLIADVEALRWVGAGAVWLIADEERELCLLSTPTAFANVEAKMGFSIAPHSRPEPICMLWSCITPSPTAL